MMLAHDVLQLNKRAMIQLFILMFNFDKSCSFNDIISFNSKVNGLLVGRCPNDGTMLDAISQKKLSIYRQYGNVLCTMERILTNSPFHLCIHHPVKNDWPNSARNPGGFIADSGQIPPRIRVTQIKPTYL